ncbi:MAG: hypothetical protein ACTHOU_05520 [Aureliella sp.]
MLIEIAICMSIGSSLVVLAIGVAHQAMTMSSRASRQVDLGRTGARLAQQFRTDAHLASRVEVENDSQTLRFELADKRSLAYSIDGSRLLRQSSSSGNAPEQPIEREAYDFGAGCQIRLATLDDPPRAELVVVRDSGLHGEDPRLELQLVAVVGKLIQAEQPKGDEP